MKISEKTIKALKILDSVNVGLTAKEFAKGMWKDSDGWMRSKNTGNGACTGKGMWLCAGGYLAKLKSAGLVYFEIPYYTKLWKISAKGYITLMWYGKITVEWCKDYDRAGRCKAWDRGIRPSGQNTGYCQVNKLCECDQSRMTKNTPL